MEKTIWDIQTRLISLEKRTGQAAKVTAKAHREAEALHEALRLAVCDHGCAAGLSPEFVSNITGPKVPPSDA